MKLALVVIAFAVLTCTVSAADKYVNETFGFEISPPEAKEFSGMYQTSMFYLPTIDGFGANVNIQIQEYDGTLQEYEKTSRDQFKQAGINVLSANVNADNLTIEYSGKMGGYELHWYARATKKAERIYLVTATSLETRWNSQSTVLKKSVDSFKLK
jgi:hypothetical protein